MKLFQDILEKAKAKNVPLQKDDIQKISELIAQSHLQDVEESVGVANILLDFSPDRETILASLLLQTVYVDTPPFEEIESIFGKTVRDILFSLRKLSLLSIKFISNPDNQYEVMRKMFLVLAKDVRVVFLKLANRLYSLEHISNIPEEKRKRFAEEVFELYAPIAARLGIYHLKRKLEKEAFQFLFPQEYQSISAQIESFTHDREQVIALGKRALKQILEEAGMSGKIQGRAKDIYSIFQKLKKKGKDHVEHLYDIFAFRILVQSIPECYAILGQIHQRWRVLAARFKDYIALPKPNGYKSLHTTIFGTFQDKAEALPVEIQIRTLQMHEEAEFGSAVHWGYKEGVEEVNWKENWILELSKKSQDLQSSQSFEIFAEDFLGDRIFVLTEKGDIKSLPAKSTPVDFAYSIHSEIGEHCQAAIVNDRIAPLNYILKNGDVVKIITAKNAVPRESWISFAASSLARQRIRAYFRKHNMEFFVKEGRTLLNEALQKYGNKGLDRTLSLLKNYGGENLPVRSREDILKKIGTGSIHAHMVAKKIIQNDEDQKKVSASGRQTISVSAGQAEVEILVSGESGFSIKKAKCCYPKPSDQIVAFTTRGGSFTVHRQNCRMLQKLTPSRFLVARWATDPLPERVYISVTKNKDCLGMLQEISYIFVIHGASLGQVHYKEGAGSATGQIFFAVEVLHLHSLESIFAHIQKIDGVADVQQITSEDARQLQNQFFQ